MECVLCCVLRVRAVLLFLLFHEVPDESHWGKGGREKRREREGVGETEKGREIGREEGKEGEREGGTEEGREGGLILCRSYSM